VRCTERGGRGGGEDKARAWFEDDTAIVASGGTGAPSLAIRPRLSVQPTLLERAGSAGGSAGSLDVLDLPAQLERDLIDAAEGTTGGGITAERRWTAAAPPLKDERGAQKGAADVTWRAARGRVGVSGSSSESSEAAGEGGLMGRRIRDPFQVPGVTGEGCGAWCVGVAWKTCSSLRRLLRGDRETPAASTNNV
jgi:hypothetical protein